MRILTYLFLLLTFGSAAQEVKLQFNFEDAMTNAPLDSIQLSVYNTSNSILFQKWTQNRSEVNIEIPKNNILRIKAIKPGYHVFDTTMNLLDHQRDVKKGNLLVFNFKMRFDGQLSGEYNINATYKPEIAFSSERINVSDFVAIDENKMVILAYPKKLNAGSELIWFENDSIVSRKKVSGNAIRLDVDYRDRIYLRCEYTDYLLSGDELLNLSKVQRDQLDNFIQPILDTLENEQLFFTTFKSHYPAFDFYKIQMEDTTHGLLHHVEDTEMMEFYRAEYKWADVRTRLWAWDMELETGIDREIWVGANVFTNSIYYEAPYSEFFLVEDEVYVFDFYMEFMFTYDASTGQKLDSLSIDFHQNPRKTGWEKRMVQDPITKKIYTIYDDAGYSDIYEINLKDGTLKDKFTLFYRYVENVQIYDEEVFYVYRPFETLQKKYLYKEGFNDSKRSLIGQDRFK